MEINNIKNVLNSLREEFIIIGLTGALGSGCTETAEILSDTNTKSKINSILDSREKDEFDVEYRKIQRVKYFYEKNEWKEFFHLRVSDILFLLFVNDIDDFTPFRSIFNGSSLDKVAEIKEICNRFFNAISTYSEYSNNDLVEILLLTNNFIKEYIDKSANLYTNLFQEIGKNIRLTGSVSKEKNIDLSEKLNLSENYENLKIFVIPEIVRRVIKLIRKENIVNNKKDFFVIDSLRNIYEIEFFRNRYQSFYLFSVMASPEVRKDRILNSFKLTVDDLETIKDFEKNNKGIESQAINACIGKGDVFIDNDIENSNKTELALQIIKYVALIRKPGLFTPSDDERFMQVAFTARYSSGCISRQVGAVVAGEDGYLRGFGWNDTPENHISCLYRTPEQLINAATNMVFSNYERSSSFKTYITNNFETNELRFHPYCFKDNQSQIELDEKAEKISYQIGGSQVAKQDIKKILEKASFKNPTRERALHAEENAFLQISKSGGESVVEGTLFTTDSPCQLCAKKTMQLKISRVVYIDAYPDISIEHTLRAGEEENWPDFEMFAGAIGSSYFKLYIPMIGRKDEIKELNKLI